MWEQIRNELRGALYQLLRSQRPDDLEDVLGHLQHGCDGEALIPVLRPFP